MIKIKKLISTIENNKASYLSTVSTGPFRSLQRFEKSPKLQSKEAALVLL